MALPYSFQTLAQARAQLSQRLYDAGQVFWIPAELNIYITEALRTFNSLAQYWRGDFVFNTTANTTWVDITQAANTLRPYTVTDVDLYTSMEYSLLEPATGATWTGTSMYNINDLMNAVQRRRDEILTTTGCTIAQSMQATTPGQVRNAVNQTVLDIRRVAWFPTPVAFYITGNTTTGSNVVSAVSNMVGLLKGQAITGSGIPALTTISALLPNNSIQISNNATAPASTVMLKITPLSNPNVMWPEDLWSFQAFEDSYAQAPPGTPGCYSISAQPPLSFDVDYTPQQAGDYELLTTNAGPVLTTASPTIIDIPDDFTWVLKWGALADLFSKEAEAKDEARAQYCNMRYQQGLKLLMNSPAILNFRINNVPLWIDAVRSADEYDTAWEGQSPATPTYVYTAGLNLIALNPTPDGIYSATCTVVENAPIPVNDGDYIQTSQGDYDAIIDYAQHLSLLKCGGAEFSQTMELYSRFVRQAALSNSKLAEMGIFEEQLYSNSQREEIMNPRMTKSAKEGADG